MNEKQMDVQLLCGELWDVEEDFDLLNLEINGVKVWQYIRMPIYYYLAELAGIFQAPHTGKRNPFSRILHAFKFLLNALSRNPFFLRGQVEQIIVEHPRSIAVEGKFVDIYSRYYVNDLKLMGISYVCLDRADLNGQHRKESDAARYHIDLLSLASKLLAIFWRTKLNHSEKTLIDSVNNRLSKRLGFSVDIGSFFVPAITKFKVNYFLYRRLLKRLKPKRLVVVVGYAYGDAIKAAKDLGIETVEIQHGTFSYYHLGYSFPRFCGELDYFPEKFLAWGSFWRDMKIVPLPEKNVVPSGFTYFTQLKGRYSHIKKEPRRIIVLSQGALGSKIADIVYHMSNALKDFEIVYKLHPGEYSRWREYDSLKKLLSTGNVRIALDEDLYELMASAKYQIGVFSTAIYEGIGFGCKTLLLDLPGIEYMSHLVEQRLVKVVDNSEDLSVALSDCEQQEIDQAAVFGNANGVGH